MKMNLKIIILSTLFFFLSNTTLAATISNFKASSNSTQIIFSFTVSAPQNFYRVYVDNTRDPTKGFAIAGTGAKFLIEKNALYKHIGPGWKWTFVKNVTFSVANNVATWTINRNDLITNTCATAIDYVFQIQSGTSTVTSAKNTLNVTAAIACESVATQKLGVPSYFYPNCTTNTNCDWNIMNKTPTKIGLTVINPGTGPGTAIDSNYSKVVAATQAAGGTVIGYVYTSYGARDIAAVKKDIDTFYKFYPLNGIFFDEGYSKDCAKASYYQELTHYVKAKGAKQLTVVNYGTNAPECYANVSDILIIYETTYTYYANWKYATWVANYPATKFWHIIYNVPQDQIYNTINKSKTNRAGYIYLTPYGMPNPYSKLPPADYWTMELNAIN